jgi:hypothetical protein
VNLLCQALRAAIDEAVKARGIENYSVVWKHNAKGDFYRRGDERSEALAGEVGDEWRAGEAAEGLASGKRS